MDRFKMAEIIRDMLDKDTCQYYGIGVNFVELDEDNSEVSLTISKNGKNKRFVIEVREV